MCHQQTIYKILFFIKKENYYNNYDVLFMASCKKWKTHIYDRLMICNFLSNTYNGIN